MRLPSVIAISIVVAAGPALTAEVALPPESRSAPVTLSVYGDGYALVWDRRGADLAAGANRLAFEGVSRQMLPSSAMIEADHDLRLVDVVYDFALLTPESLLRRSLGRQVGVVRTHPATGEETVETATLLSIEGGVILRYRDRIETGDPGRLVFFDVPADLRPRPTLLATLNSGAAGRRDVTLGYLTRGLGWSTDYVALWNEAGGEIELTGRATLSNTTGTDFPDADLALIAGTVNRETPMPAPMGRMQAAPMMAEAKSMPARQEFAALHLYKVPGRVGLADQQTKQVTLLATARLPVKQEYVSESGIATYRQTGEPQPTHPQVRLRFENAAGEGGGPMPAGVVRVYAAAADDTPRLVGEDRVEHTPIGAAVTLTPGEAFDLSVLRRQTEFVRSGLPDNVSESAWTIEVKNARDKPATVDLVEAVPGDWTILAESAKHEKQTAERLVWKLAVAPKGTAQLSYRIRVQQ